MCGIWMLLKEILNKDYSNEYDENKFRGPDSTNLYQDNNLLTTFHRLAINDLSHDGDQPFIIDRNDAKYLLVCNGEIYNYNLLRKEYRFPLVGCSDCEILLYLYLELNEDIEIFLDKIRGEFAIVIVKIMSDDTYHIKACVDKHSVRPLFYGHSNSSIGFSSVFPGLTPIFDNVTRLHGGNYLSYDICYKNVFNNSVVSLKSYYNRIIFKDHTITSELELYELIVNTFYEAVGSRIHCDRELGCLLSGGLDSSLVAAVASDLLRNEGKVLNTFTISMENGTDYYYANLVADHIKCNHRNFSYTSQEGVSVLDDVFDAISSVCLTTNRASTPQFILAKKISEETNIKVILNGDGADELQMGYIYFYSAPNINEAEKDRDRLLDEIHLFDGARVDRTLGRWGLEARLPFLDDNFISLFRSIDPTLLLPTKDFCEKYLIRKAFSVIKPDLLPHDVLWRRKEAFSDGVSSKEKSWYSIIQEYYNTKVTDVEFNTFLESDEVNNVLKLFRERKGIITKEHYYLYKRYKQKYGNNDLQIPYYWLPSWTSESDPSARKLDIYEN